MIFQNREDAAEQLVPKLLKFKNHNPIILAVPRGAVPMGKIIADKLDAELDVVLVRKVGVPGNPELAAGSVTESGDVFPNEVGIELGISEKSLKTAAKEVLSILKTRRKMYSQARPPIDLKGKTVIIIDDGIATGSTIIAALNSIKKQNPSKLIVAAAVAPPGTVDKFQSQCDEFIVLDTPSDFYAIGQFYVEFPQVTDEEVCRHLRTSHNDYMRRHMPKAADPAHVGI